MFDYHDLKLFHLIVHKQTCIKLKPQNEDLLTHSFTGLV